MSASQAVVEASRQETGDDFVDSFQLSARWLESSVEHTHRITDRRRGIRNAVRVERWERKKELGRGGFGTVYLEEDQHGQLRAVKEVKKTVAPKVHTIDFLREILAMAHFSQEEALFVKFEGWYQSKDLIHIAMEYFPNGDLSDCVKQPLFESEVQVITHQVAEGLEFMHAKKFAHRDIKPSNVFVVSTSPSWWIKLGDFGVAKRVKDDSTSMHTSIATEFTAPEMAGFVPMKDEADCYTSKVDIWSLGCLCYWLLTQKLPLGKLQVLPFCMGRIKLPIEALVTHEVTSEGIDFLGELLQAQPNDRFAASDVLHHSWPKEPSGTKDGEGDESGDALHEDGQRQPASAVVPEIPAKSLHVSTDNIRSDSVSETVVDRQGSPVTEAISSRVESIELKFPRPIPAAKFNYLLDIGFTRMSASKALAFGDEEFRKIIHSTPRTDFGARDKQVPGMLEREAPEPLISARKKEILEKMGFSSEGATIALVKFSNDLQKSINDLSRSANGLGNAVLPQWPLTDEVLPASGTGVLIPIQVTIVSLRGFFEQITWISPSNPSVAIWVNGSLVHKVPAIPLRKSTEKNTDPSQTFIISCPQSSTLDMAAYYRGSHPGHWLIGFAAYKVIDIVGTGTWVDMTLVRTLEDTPTNADGHSTITANFKFGHNIRSAVASHTQAS